MVTKERHDDVRAIREKSNMRMMAMISKNDNPGFLLPNMFEEVWELFHHLVSTTNSTK
jgi:hypothetical protein